MFILISGTSGSGKSSHAEKILSTFPEPTKIYIATAQITDAEMSARVERHKKMRAGKNFLTLECPRDLEKLNIPKNSCVLIESLTTWTANEMFCDDCVDDCEAVIKKICRAVSFIISRSQHVIIVADDIFSDGNFYDELTEKYMRTLAELEKIFARQADEVIECFAGLCVKYKTGENIL